MPLARVQLKNEYGLGVPELYAGANTEDPKSVLEGATVAGLVGILRQLGDLAEFAAEVFHGLQEQVTTTASRSHKVMVRVQKIEVALPQIEKFALAQTSHIHLAYTAGSDWHAQIQNKKSHFFCGDLPRFIMDSYEECRDPPRLYLLDRFDTGGPGSCLKRYTDPSFFKRVSASYDEANAKEVRRDKKACKRKKRRSRQINGEILHDMSVCNRSSRMQFASAKLDMTSEFKPRKKLDSFDSKSGPVFTDRVSHSSFFDLPPEEESIELPSTRLEMQHCDSPIQLEEKVPAELPSSSITTPHSDNPDSDFLGELNRDVNENLTSISAEEQAIPNSSSVRWDEKTEIVGPNSPLHENANTMDDFYDAEYIKLEIVECKLQQHDMDKCPEMSDLDIKKRESATAVDRVQISNDSEFIKKSVSGSDGLDEIESETDNFMDALNSIDSESESDLDCQAKTEVNQFSADISDCESDPTEHPTADLEFHITASSSPTHGMSLNLLKPVSAMPMTAKTLAPGISPVACIVEDSDSLVCSQSETRSGDPASSSSAANCSLPPTGDNLDVDICRTNLGFPDHSRFESICNSPCSTSSCSSPPPNDEKIVSSSPVVDTCENGDSESAYIDPSSSSLTIYSSVPSGEKVFSCSPAVNISENAHSSGYPNLESVCSDPASSSSAASSLPSIGEKLLSSCLDVDIYRTNLGYSDHSRFETVSNSRCSTFSSCSSPPPNGERLVNSSPVVDTCENASTSDYLGSDSAYLDPSPCSSTTCSSVPSGEKVLSGSENADSSGYSNFESVCGDSASSSSAGTSSVAPNGEMVVSISPIVVMCNAGTFDHSGSESPYIDPSSSSSAICSSVLSGEKVLSCSLAVANISENPVSFGYSNFDSVCSDPSSACCMVGSFQAPTGDMFIANSPVADVCETAENLDSSDLGLVDPLPSAVGTCVALNDEKVILTVCESQEPAEDFPAVQSIKIWTNGGLLGLEPSKPPDFSAMKSEESVEKITKAGARADRSAVLEDDGHGVDSAFSAKLEGSGNVSENSRKCFKESSRLMVEAEQSAAPDFKAASTAQENNEHSFNVLGPRNRLMANGFHRMSSLVLDDQSELAADHHGFLNETILNDKLGYGYGGSYLDSPSSPPLEHMKISFHPLNALDNAKLKLRFLDKNELHHGSGGDVLSSFQLIPEPAILPQDILSDSDDDTFCNSSPYISDDYHSKSDSEQWEAGEMIGCRNHELNSTLSRNSSLEFIPSSVEGEQGSCGGNGVELLICDQLLELPSFDMLDASLLQDSDAVSRPEDCFRSQHLIDSAQLPPPSSHLQWKTVNPCSSVAECNQDEGCDMKIVESSISDHPGPASAGEAVASMQESKRQRNLNGQQAAAQAAHRNGMDERKDFLEQIRSKSFNLRRAAPSRPTFTVVPTTPGKVTAILEKANAIRQAVGSDDGEDEDNWSDV